MLTGDEYEGPYSRLTSTEKVIWSRDAVTKSYRVELLSPGPYGLEWERRYEGYDRDHALMKAAAYNEAYPGESIRVVEVDSAPSDR